MHKLTVSIIVALSTLAVICLSVIYSLSSNQETTNQEKFIENDEDLGREVQAVYEVLEVDQELEIEQIDITALESQLTERTEGVEADIAFGIYHPKSKLKIVINPGEVLPPASLSKLPYAILTLRDIDAGLYSLSDEIAIDNDLKPYTSDVLYDMPHGTKLTIQQYLEYLIIESDNTAMYHLERLLGGFEKVNSRSRVEIGNVVLQRWPHITTIEDVLDLMIFIESEELLSSESQRLLIERMVNTSPRFHNRIKAGLADEDAVVAHKIGNLISNRGIVVNDAAIIYDDDMESLVIAVITVGMENEQKANQLIADLARISYQFFKNL